MDLKTYLKSLSPEDRTRFARRIGSKPSYLPQLSGGHRLPSWKLAKAIHRASGGKVRLESLRPDIFGGES